MTSLPSIAAALAAELRRLPCRVSHGPGEVQVPRVVSQPEQPSAGVCVECGTGLVCTDDDVFCPTCTPAASKEKP
jgi:hypothetical protein